MTTKEAKDFLRSEGYFVDNLWHVSDVQDKFECNEETAQDILYWTLTSPTMIESINDDICNIARNEQLNTK